MIDIYTDGGIIGRNPSKLGGTWACRLVEHDCEIAHIYGVVTPMEIGLPTVTNNVTELLAVVQGMKMLPDNWTGVIHTDSNVTLLRVRLNYAKPAKMNGVPQSLQYELARQKKRLGIYHVKLLGGHPTKAELEKGWRMRPDGVSRDVPVSKHNVFCDELCQRQAKAFLERQASQAAV